MNKDVTWSELLVEGEGAVMRSDNTGRRGDTDLLRGVWGWGAPTS